MTTNTNTHQPLPRSSLHLLPETECTQAIKYERQRVLFAGLKCLHGQRDLFPTDGPREER
jgi:hypothetical protein